MAIKRNPRWGRWLDVNEWLLKEIPDGVINRTLLMSFNGRNILPGFPDGLVKVVRLLNEKAESGEFTFSDSLSYWKGKESVVNQLGLKLEGDGYYYAVSLAYLASLKDGHVEFPEGSIVWRWAWSLNILADCAGWPPSIMKNVVESFPCREDGIDGLMGSAANTYARRSFDNGLALMEELPKYRVSILAGLMENDFARYCSLFPPQNNQEEFANAFVQAYRMREEDVASAYDIAMEFHDFTSNLAMDFLLTAHQKLDDGRKTVCETRVKDLLESGITLQYVIPVTNWMFRFRENSPFMEDCVFMLVRGLGKENANYLAAVDKAIAYTYDNVDFYSMLFLCVAENLGPTEVLKLQDCLDRLYEKQDDMLNIALLFILHPKGMYRVVGRRLWDEYHLEKSDFNAADLDESIQYIFIISMLQDFGNPETRLPKVLPLLMSESKSVRNVLMNCMQKYVDEYMGHVTSALDKLQIDCEEAGMIRKYVKNKADAIKARRELKELLPEYTYDKEYREAMRMQNEHTREIMKEAEANRKPTWMDSISTVVLARGGAWRDANGINRPLIKTSFSMPSRMMAESMSPKEKDEWINQLLRDWDDTTGNH